MRGRNTFSVTCMHSSWLIFISEMIIHHLERGFGEGGRGDWGRERGLGKGGKGDWGREGEGMGEGKGEWGREGGDQWREGEGIGGGGDAGSPLCMTLLECM